MKQINILSTAMQRSDNTFISFATYLLIIGFSAIIIEARIKIAMKNALKWLEEKKFCHTACGTQKRVATACRQIKKRMRKLFPHNKEAAGDTFPKNIKVNHEES